jgi:drug/metabolite transporter (DMT)-like permease
VSSSPDTASSPLPSHEEHAALVSVLGVVLILTTLAAWTAAPVLMKYFTQHMDVWTMNGWRYGAAALLWSPLIVWQMSRRSFPKRLWKASALPAIFNSVGQVALVSSLYFTDPTMIAFALRVQLITVAVGGAIVFAAERRVIRRPAFLVGMAMILVGICSFVALDESSARAAQQGSGWDVVIGALLGGAAGASFGCYALAVRPVMRFAGPMISYAVISAYTALAMLALMLALGEDFGAAALALAPGVFALLIASAIIALFIGHPAYYGAIRRLGVTASAAVLQLQPFTIGITTLVLAGVGVTGFTGSITLAQWAMGAVAAGGACVMLWVQHATAKRDRAQHAARPAPEPAVDVEGSQFEEGRAWAHDEREARVGVRG